MKKIVSYILPVSMMFFLLIFGMATIFRVSDSDHLYFVKEHEYPESYSLEDVKNGKFQREFALWFNDHFWYRNTAVRWKNQLLYSVFQDRVVNGIHGKDDFVLAEEDTSLFVAGKYSNKYSEKEYLEYALSVKKMQDRLKKKGKKFIYIITPLKAEILPEKLPWRYKILYDRYYSSGEGFHASLIKAMKEAGVCYYDTTSDLWQAKNNGEYEVFVKSGVHWTFSAAAYEMVNVLKYMQALDNKADYPQMEVVGVNNELYPIDNDLAVAFNVKFPIYSDKYTSPIIKYNKKSDLKLYLFGCSFSEQIADAFSNRGRDNAFKKLIHQQYFTDVNIITDQGKEHRSYSEKCVPEDLDVMKNIDDSDIIIMEQNVILGLLPTHIKFVNYVNAQLMKNEEIE